MPKRFDAIAVQEDDYGALNLFAVERTTGETHHLRQMKYDDMMANFVKGMRAGANVFFAFDTDGVVTFYSLDGRRLFSTAATCDNWQGTFKKDFFHSNGDVYTFYCVDRSGYYCSVVINPKTKSVTTTQLFLVSSFTDFSAANTKLAWQTGADLYAITRNSAGYGFYWKLISGTWTKVSLGPALDYGNNVDINAIPINSTGGIVEWTVKDNAKSRNYEKFVLNVNTAVASTAVIASNVYSTAPPPTYFGGTLQLIRSDNSNTATWAQGVNASEAHSMSGAYNTRGATFSLDAVNSGPNGQGRGVIFTELDGFSLANTVNMGRIASPNVLMFDFYFDNLTGNRLLITNSTGAGLHIHDGRLKMSSNATGSTSVYAPGDPVIVPTGQWVRIGFCHDPSSDYKWRVSVNGAVQVIDATSIGFSTFTAYSIGKPTGASNVGFVGKLGGLYQGNAAGGYDFLGAPLLAVPAPATVPVDPIRFTPTPARGVMTVIGDVVVPSTASDNAAPKFITDGSAYTPPTGSYTNVSGSARSWAETGAAVKVGTFIFQIAKYGVRTLISGGATLFQYLQPSEKDREMYVANLQAVIRDLPIYEVTGIVKNEDESPIVGATMKLLDNVTLEELATTTTDASGVYRFYCLTNEKVAVKFVSANPAVNSMINAHITPLQVV